MTRAEVGGVAARGCRSPQVSAIRWTRDESRFNPQSRPFDGRVPSRDSTHSFGHSMDACRVAIQPTQNTFLIFPSYRLPVNLSLSLFSLSLSLSLSLWARRAPCALTGRRCFARCRGEGTGRREDGKTSEDWGRVGRARVCIPSKGCPRSRPRVRAASPRKAARSRLSRLPQEASTAGPLGTSRPV